ncbi:MAG: DUF5011 domain-containing protein, partial [Oscillospiraceae bacterium]|nr:DUF5011 domain-containing protein [Oscillospiraceae bacterium]
MEKLQTKKTSQRRTVTKGLIWAVVAVVVLALVGLAVFGIFGKGGDDAPSAATEATSDYEVELALVGEETIVLGYADAFTDPGCTALGRDVRSDGQCVELEVRVEGQVDCGVVGRYVLTYSAGFQGVVRSVTRTVEVVDTVAPEIFLVEDEGHYTLPGETYQEEGFTATDEYYGDLTDRVERREEDGVVYYSVTDPSGNVAQVQRAIRYHDPEAPVLKLQGADHMKITAGDAWSDPGCVASDNVDGDLSDKIVISGSVDRNTAGTYVLTYEVTDSYGNKASVRRTVVVEKRWQPETVEPNGKVIYLTFDDGPWSDTPELLEVLRKYDVKATFFVVNNTKFIHMLSDIAADGHTVAN